MKQIKNINQVNVGDIILLVPNKLYLNSNTKINFNFDNNCFIADLCNCDIESFGEEIGIGNVKLYDKIKQQIYIENIYTHHGMWVPIEMPLTYSEKTYWKI